MIRKNKIIGANLTRENISAYQRVQNKISNHKNLNGFELLKKDIALFVSMFVIEKKIKTAKVKKGRKIYMRIWLK